MQLLKLHLLRTTTTKIRRSDVMELFMPRRLDATPKPTSTAREAEVAFEQAVTEGRRQHTRTFELRAATDLAHFWKGQGKSAAARKVLKPICNSLAKEGATPDLNTAMTLLQTLS